MLFELIQFLEWFELVFSPISSFLFSFKLFFFFCFGIDNKLVSDLAIWLKWSIDSLIDLRLMLFLALMWYFFVVSSYWTGGWSDLGKPPTLVEKLTVIVNQNQNRAHLQPTRIKLTTTTFTGNWYYMSNT